MCRRLASLDRARRILVVEAAALMAAAWIALRVLPFLTLRRLFHRYADLTSKTTGATDADAIQSVRWAITAVAAYLPWATCLVQALAAGTMLRRKRIASELRFGVRTGTTGGAPIEGHAWVDCGR